MISIIICTYNRAESLEKTLDSLLAQTGCDGINYEVIIIDNNSTDHTKNTVESFGDKFNGRLKYVFEKRRGLSLARNRGVRESRGKILTFTDDDCIVSKNWVSTVKNIFLKCKKADIVTGGTLPYNSNTGAQSTKTSNYIEAFEYPSNPWDIGNGNNFAVKREVFQKIPCFDERLGAGTFISSGEDTNFFYRVLKNGFKIVYEPSMLIYHNHGRISDAEIHKTEHSYAKGRGAFYANNFFSFYVLKLLYREIKMFRGKYYISIKDKNVLLEKKVLRNLSGLFLGFVYLTKERLLNPCCFHKK